MGFVEILLIFEMVKKLHNSYEIWRFFLMPSEVILFPTFIHV